MTVRSSLAMPRTWPLWPLMLLLAVLLLYPVGQILVISFFNRAGELSLFHYGRLFASSVYVRILANTFEIAGWTTLICVVLGYPIAYVLATARSRPRAFVTLLVLLPFWTSFLVRTFAWIIILGRKGLMNNVLGYVGVEQPVAFIYNYAGVLIGMTHALMPIAILTMSSVMESIPKDLTRAAGTLGAREGQAFLRVYFPLSFPGVAAAGLMVFISAIGFFITPALLGGPRQTMMAQVIIDSIQTLLDWGMAGAIVMLLLVATLIVFIIYDRIVGLSSLSGETQQRRGGRPASTVSKAMRALTQQLTTMIGYALDAVSVARERIAGRREKKGSPLLYTLVFLILAFLVVPSFVVIPVSFTESQFLEWPPKGFTWQWYETYIHSPLWLSATWRSLVVALVSAAGATLIGVPAAFVIAKRIKRFRGALLALVLLPMILPRMIIAVGLFYVFARWGLVGTMFGLVLSHILLAVPYVVVTMMAVLKNYDERFEHAAGTLGARPFSVVRYITLPLVRPGLISAFLFAFVTSFDELTVALFVTGGLSATLPKQMWDDALLKVSPILAAVSTVALVSVTIVVLLGEFYRRRSVRKLGGR